MIKLRELIDEKKCGIGQNPEDTGCEPASGGKGKKKKYKQGAKKLTDPKTAKFGAKSSALQGPESAKDAVGTDQKEEQVIAKGMQKLGALAKSHRDKQEKYKNGEIDEDPGDFKVPEEYEKFENLCNFVFKIKDHNVIISS